MGRSGGSAVTGTMFPMVDVVCLDLMGTVLYDPYLEAIEAATGMGIREVIGVKDPDSWPQFEMGLIDEAEFVRRFFAQPEAARVFDVDAFHRVRLDGYRFLDGVEALLDELAGEVPCYVASNYPVWIEDLGLRFDFARRFDGVYASCHLGVRKPDPAFFEGMLSAIGVAAHQVLFVDDRRVNCDAAAALGMHVHVFEDAAGLRRCLREAGVLP